MSRLAERLGEVLEELVSECINEREIEADSIKGLDDAFESYLDDNLPKPDLEADDIRGFTDTVRDVIRDEWQERDFCVTTDQVEDLDEHIMEVFAEGVDEFLARPCFQAKLDQAVQQSLLRVFAKLIAGVVPTALPAQADPAPIPQHIVEPDPGIRPARFNQEGGIIQEN